MEKNRSKSDHVKYEGEYLHDELHGEGRIETKTGFVWAGTWKDGKQDKENK